MEKIAIIQCFNEHSAGLGTEFSTDFENVCSMLNQTGWYPEFKLFDLMKMEIPAPNYDFDGIIITGSPESVNSETEQNRNLLNFVRNADAIETPMVGICFGHQVIAKALGGTVGRIEHGWNVGFRSTEILEFLEFMSPIEQLIVPALHNEEIKILPNGFKHLGSSKNCKFSLVGKNDHIFSTQMHPEMPPSFLDRLIELDPSLKGVCREDDAEQINGYLFGIWVRDFFQLRR